MAFSKAPIKRFNDFNENDATAPPPGAYNPLFVTDVGNSANTKISISRLPRSLSVSRTEPSSPGPILRRHPSPSPSRGKVVPIASPPSQLPRCHTALTGIHMNFPQEKNPGLEVKYHEADRKLKEMQRENTAIKDQLAKLHDDKNNWAKTAESCQVTITELNASLQDLKIQLDKSAADENLLKEAFEKAEQTWKDKTGALQSSIQELQKSLGEHVEKRSELENVLKRSEKEKQTLEGDRQKMAQALENSQSALQASEKKCQLLEENMGKCYSVYQQELNGIQGERDKWQETEAELVECARVSKGQIDSLKIAVQAEKSGRIQAEGKIAGLMKLVQETENNTVALRAEWEVKEKELMSEVERLESALKSYIESPALLLNKSTNNMAKEVLEQRKSNAELKSKVEQLERMDSIRKQEMEIDVASTLHEQGILKFHVKNSAIVSEDEKPSSILGAAFANSKFAVPDTTLPQDIPENLKKKIQELQSSAKTLQKTPNIEDDLQATRVLISAIEADNEEKRQCISLFAQDENANDKKESSSSSSLTSSESMKNFRSDEKYVPGGSIVALGPSPAVTNLGSEKSPTSSSEGLISRASMGRILGKLAPIAEEEEDKHK